MTVKSLVCVGIVVLCAGAVGAQENLNNRRLQTPKVQRWIDGKTGLEIRLSQSAPQEAVVDVADNGVSIRKVITQRRTVTTISAAGEELRLTTQPGGVEVRTADNETATASLDSPSLDRMATLLGKSRAALAGLRLLTRLDLTPNSFATNALLLTQALLEAPSGIRTAASIGTQWAREHAAAAKVVKASLSVTGPGDCWNEYSGYLMEIANDFADCSTGCRWYQVGCPTACEFVWVLRAELAMDWLIGCSGGLPVR